jgi:hypothetical protein
MEVILALSEGLDIFCVVEPSLSLRLHCQTWELVTDLLLVLEPRGSDRPGILTPRASVLTFHPIRQSNLALARARKKNFSTKCIHKAGHIWGCTIIHVGALVKWPRNDELRIVKANRMASKIFNEP